MNTTPKMFLLTVWILLGVAGVATQAEPTDIPDRETDVPPFTPLLAMEDCTFPDLDRTARCGTLTVAEDPEDPEGRKIDLYLVVLPARSGEPRRDAVTYLVGGPGQAATSIVGFFGDSLGGLQEHHDLVLVDQRGTGRSNPLDCKLKTSELARAIVGGAVPASGLEACRAELDADPSFYTTPIAMDDLDAVRTALDYERFHLIGVSYGSRAALVYSRRHPDRVASLVLRGVTSPADNIPLSWLRSGEASMAGLLARCATDKACNAAYPKLREQLEQILSDLEDRSAAITVRPRGADRNVELELTRDVFAGALQLALYSDRSAARIPRLIDRAAAGDFELFGQGLVGALLATSQSLHLGMYLSVICAEDVPFLELEGIDQEPWSFQDPVLLANLIRTCRGWPSGRMPDGYKQPVVSTAPALLLSGSTDPATSPGPGQEVASHLPNSRHLITPGLGHHPSWTSCFANLAGSLINGASIHELDVTCVEEERTSDFDIPISRRAWMLLGALGIGLVALIGLWRRRR